MIPQVRIRKCNEQPVREDARYVLYWMTANRRRHYNASLERAVEHCRDHGLPLVVLEALRCDYRWASDRFHQFVFDGMQDNLDDFDRQGVRYYAYVEPKKGAGKGLLQTLATDAAIVVADDFPAFFLPEMLAAASEKLDVRVEAVDGNGLWPMHATEREFTVAHSFRRHLHKELLPHLEALPERDPLLRMPRVKSPSIDRKTLDKWPPVTVGMLRGEDIGDLPIDHSVAPTGTRGGVTAARKALETFMDKRLSRYNKDRNEPAVNGTSGFSPYLHFGHLSVHEVWAALVDREEWSPDLVRAADATGQRAGFWGMSEEAESFLDELLTWREIGYNFCSRRPDYDQYESLPDWAQETLRKHAGDPREYLYDLEEFETAQTHDELWNAAQNQLRSEGRIHNYLRMLWGKKILGWSESPQEALATMIELNNKYALDGRNPNSYSGIFWVLGRYDRAWGPERQVFGKIRFMSSKNTARKVKTKEYVRAYRSIDAPA